MRYFIVGVRDRAADCFSVPMYWPSVGIAIRNFTDEVKRVADNNAFNRHPEDFDLYLFGQYDDGGKFEIDETPRMIAVGKDVAR